MRRMTSAVASLSWTSVLLIGLPAVLIRLVGWPLPRHMPTGAEWTAWAQQPLTRAALLDTAAILAWLMWAALLATVLATAYGRVARLRRHLPNLRLPGPLQSLSAAMLGTVAVSTSVSTVTMPPAHAAVAADNLPHLGGPNLSTRVYRTTEVPPPDPAVAAPSAPGGSAAAPMRAPNAPGGVHHVVRGDTLWDIAKAKLGDPTRWHEIYALNQGRPQANGHVLTDPDEIDVGWALVLPTIAPPPVQAAPPANPAPATPAPPAQTPASPAPATSLPASPAPANPAPANPAPQATAVDPGNPSASAGSSTLAPSPHPTGEHPAPQHSDHENGEQDGGEHGVNLPSQGWVSLGLAATIAVAAALLRLQRRRRARLRFPIPVRTGPQPAPIPPSLSTVDAAGSRLLDLDTGDSALPGVVPAPQTVPAPVGVDEHGGEVSLFELPGPGVALDGPGAVPAARAILAAVLSTGLVAHLADRAIVVTSADTLARLLPPGAPPVGINTDRTSFDGERLIVLPDTAAVVTYGEEEMIHRRRLLDSMGMDTVAALNARNDHLENQTQCVLLLDADPRHAAWLRAVAAHRDALWLHPVILGRHDGIPTLDVHRDGTVLTAEAELSGEPALPVVRLATLAGRDLVDVLALVAEVAPHQEEGIDIDQVAQAAHANTEPNAGTPEDHPIDAAGIGGVEVDPAALGGSSGDAAAEVEIPARNGDTVPLARLSVLGPLTVAADTGTVGAGMRSGSYGVLAMLAAHPSGRTREQLAAALYPTVNPELADNRVRTDTTTARRVLRQATGHNEAKFILYDAGTGLYRLDPDTIDVDLWRMLTAIQAANTATDDTECLAALRQAAECYGGEFAQGQDRAWALDYATTYRHQILGAYARIAEILEADHPDQAIAALETAINLDPVNEELYQRLMRIHGRLGRPDAVRRTLRLLEDRLADLGEAEPSEATRRVAMRQLKPTLTRPR